MAGALISYYSFALFLVILSERQVKGISAFIVVRFSQTNCLPLSVSERNVDILCITTAYHVLNALDASFHEMKTAYSQR